MAIFLQLSRIDTTGEKPCHKLTRNVTFGLILLDA